MRPSSKPATFTIFLITALILDVACTSPDKDAPPGASTPDEEAEDVGGSSVILASGRIGQIAVDDTDVYYTELNYAAPDEGAIKRVSRFGGDSETSGGCEHRQTWLLSQAGASSTTGTWTKQSPAHSPCAYS